MKLTSCLASLKRGRRTDPIGVSLLLSSFFVEHLFTGQSVIGPYLLFVPSFIEGTVVASGVAPCFRFPFILYKHLVSSCWSTESGLYNGKTLLAWS